MSRWTTFLNSVHLAALGLWAGILLMLGAALALLFPTVKAQRPTLPDFAAYTGDHGRISAGMVAQKLFLVSDIAIFLLALLSAGTLAALVLMNRASLRGTAGVLRSVAVAVALACVAALLLIVTPQINAASQMHWASARKGDITTSNLHIAAVDDLHPIGTALMSAELIAVLIAFWTGLVSVQRNANDAAPAPAANRSKYEEPALTRKRCA